jgi:ribosomal protein S18 acetylase RimI-like enzyme
VLDIKVTTRDIRVATLADNEQLIALTASTPMAGRISLRIDRQPDFFRLLNERGESRVLVAEKEGKIVGCISFSRQQAYINNRVHDVIYLGDFKIDPLYRGSRIALLLLAFLKEQLQTLDADLIFCTMADGNHLVKPFFEGRLQINPFEEVGVFNVFQFISATKKQDDRRAVTGANSKSEIIEFLDRHHRKYQLGAVIGERQLAFTTNFVVRSPSGALEGVICLLDTHSWKQNVVVGLTRPLRFMVKLAGIVMPLFSMSSLPEVGEPVRTLYAKYFVAKDRKVARSLVEFGRDTAHRMDYSFLSIGLHDKDPLGRLIQNFPKFTFHSRGMMTSLKKNQDLINTVKSGILYEDYSLV